MAAKRDSKLSAEEQYKRNLERLEKLRPIDDTLMRELFRDDLPLAQLVLRIITNKDDLVLTKQETQYDMERLLGARSVCLDVLAVDSEGRKYNLEIQRSDNGAAPKRARYHSSAMDIEFLNASEDFDMLLVTYVIFITENDVFKKGRPIYSFTRMNEETGEPFGDDEHIIFVNGAYQNTDDNSDLAKLIHDFKCNKADEMYIEQLAEKTRYCKENTKGVSNMCRIMEEAIEEAVEETTLKISCRNAVKMLKRGNLSVEDIAKDFELPLETVRELAEKYVNGSVNDPNE